MAAIEQIHDRVVKTCDSVDHAESVLNSSFAMMRSTALSMLTRKTMGRELVGSPEYTIKIIKTKLPEFNLPVGTVCIELISTALVKEKTNV